MEGLENKNIEFRCRMCGRYYEANAKVCVLDIQKLSDEFEILIFERHCPNCGYLNKEVDRDLKRRFHGTMNGGIKGNDQTR